MQNSIVCIKRSSFRLCLAFILLLIMYTDLALNNSDSESTCDEVIVDSIFDFPQIFLFLAVGVCLLKNNITKFVLLTTTF